MALNPNFPTSPYAILDPEVRWFPGEEALREKTYEKLLPPLVANLRREVKRWRDNNYAGATPTSKALLIWWFETEHIKQSADGTTQKFQYYFAQREAVETVIYLTDVVGTKDKYDLMRFDASGSVTPSMFPESWRRYVIKMATGSGKTKVLSLLLAWSFFHKMYEGDSNLSRNFLMIAPNIIVLERLRADFDGLKIYYSDPVIPDIGYADKNWKDDFQLTLHIQDDLGVVRKTGNIFLTNIHRVYEGKDDTPSFEDEDTMDYFLGKRPTGKTNDSKVDLVDIVKDIDELAVFNDEAHHIHDEKLAWFKSIQDIHNRLKMKGLDLSLQIDVTATPKHNNGAIFAQTVSDYSLVEAIFQNVVKHPVLPDKASRAKLAEKPSSRFTEKYEDYIHLGYQEWEKTYDENIKIGKKSILFVMVDDTKNCDLAAEYLENRYPALKGAVLVIHTKNNGDVAEGATPKAKQELEMLRSQANHIDKSDSPYKAIVSVLMLKEGWDVKNVTTIVGLRAYSAKSNILPEQTLGRGLRRMYFGEDINEPLSVVGTDAFMEFVESIKDEGVTLEHKPMGQGTAPNSPIVIEVDRNNGKKDIAKLDITIPVLSPRIFREYKHLSLLQVENFRFRPVGYKSYTIEEQREITFKDLASGEVTHVTHLDSGTPPNYQSIIGFFVLWIMRELRLVSEYDVLFGKVKDFAKNYLYGREVELNDPNTLKNLTELESTKTINETFKREINAISVVDKGKAEITQEIRVSETRPFAVKEQGYLLPQKCLFNKIIGDSHFELEFAQFLEQCEDIVSYTKNYLGLRFKIDYQDADGNIRDYYPDFIVKISDHEIYIVETKGLEDLDVPHKIKRLAAWCEDVNNAQVGITYKWLYIKQEDFQKYQAKNFRGLIGMFGA